MRRTMRLTPCMPRAFQELAREERGPLGTAHLRQRERAAAHEQPPLRLQPLQRGLGGRQDGIAPRRCSRSQA